MIRDVNERTDRCAEKRLEEAKTQEELSGMLKESEKRLTEDELGEVAGGCLMLTEDEKGMLDD